MRLLPGLAALVLLAGCTSEEEPAAPVTSSVREAVRGTAVRAPVETGKPSGPSTGPPAWVLPPPQCAGWLATVVGTAGPDRLRGTAGADVVLAGGGDDRVTGVGADDRVCAGPGDDVVRASEDGLLTRVVLGAGDDVFRGASWRVDPGAGSDVVVVPAVADPEVACVHFAGTRDGITADLARGWARGQGSDRLRGVHCLVGTAYADHLAGTHGSDTLAVCEPSSRVLETRRNTVRARAGDDEVVGCEGPDLLVLGEGDDTGIGGAGPDTLEGGAGADDLLGLGGADVLDGGPGRDDGCAGRGHGSGTDRAAAVERLTPCP